MIRNMRNLLLPEALCIMALLSLFSCSKKDDADLTNPTTISTTTLAVNKFIHDDMDTYYYWRTQMPTLDYSTQTDSKTYFDDLLYTTDDHWSYITDDYASLSNSFQGVEKSFGYSLTFGQFSNATGTYFAIVEYVYPNTPAANAGLKRGDLIIKDNGASITASNYTDLLYKDNITLTMGTLTSTGISTGGTITMTGQELTLNPVLKYTAVTVGSHKIGYLAYEQFISSFNSSIDQAIQYFKNQQITDLVLDLRYNPGGEIDAAQHLCSCLAPAATVAAKSLLVTYHWNDDIQTYFTQKLSAATTQTDKDYYNSQLQVNFDNTVATNLDLHSLYVLTTRGTASASELTIAGLKPYMTNIYTVGDTTDGKYTASITLQPYKTDANGTYVTDSNGDPILDSSISNWALQPIVLRYANAAGLTEFKKGFVPSYYVYDELLPTDSSGNPITVPQLGDPTEPLFSEAIAQITGTATKAIRLNRSAFPYKVIDRMSSRFQRFHENLIIPTRQGQKRIVLNK